MIVPDAFPVLCQPTFLRSQRNKCFTASPCENTQFHFNFHTSWLSIFQLCSQSSELYLFVPWQTFFPLSYICIFHSIYITMPSVLDINYPTHTHIFLSVSNFSYGSLWSGYILPLAHSQQKNHYGFALSSTNTHTKLNKEKIKTCTLQEDKISEWLIRSSQVEFRCHEKLVV